MLFNESKKCTFVYICSRRDYIVDKFPNKSFSLTALLPQLHTNNVGQKNNNEKNTQPKKN
jgi:hypothetical protein